MLCVVRYFLILVYDYYTRQSFKENVATYLKSNILCFDLLKIYFFATLGQVVVFKIIESEGPLALSIYTGTRKVLTILISIFWFNKSLNLIQIVAVALGLLVLVVEIFESDNKKNNDDVNKIMVGIGQINKIESFTSLNSAISKDSSISNISENESDNDKKNN